MKSSKFKVQSSKIHDRARRRRPSVFELRTSNFELPVRAFTLVEMMVVVAIIALLLAALLPAFSAVRGQAKLAQASAQFKALDTGINAFRAEAALGGTLPPSAGDDTDPPTDRQTIADPQGEDPNTKVRIAGAHLLVHAMIGADGLGTPGFRDVTPEAKGLWSHDTHKKYDAATGKSGIYAVDPATGKEKFPRYGGAGYVDEKMKESAKTLQELADKGTILNLAALEGGSPKIASGQRVFTDPWDHPILYYKANPTALRMTGASGKPGIYWQEDNAIITGSAEGLLGEVKGLDFGASTDEHGQQHWIHGAKSPDPSVKVVDVASQGDDYKHTFARFILDGSVKARPTPVQKDAYLLISAGPDARYGTDDDVLNWTRKTD
ncbi:MAG: prepilin-type N-terminal cleavage/methylation domain-containing protein [Planctomycetota bacterium]